MDWMTYVNGSVAFLVCDWYFQEEKGLLSVLLEWRNLFCYLSMKRWTLKQGTRFGYFLHPAKKKIDFSYLKLGTLFILVPPEISTWDYVNYINLKRKSSKQPLEEESKSNELWARSLVWVNFCKDWDSVGCWGGQHDEVYDGQTEINQ